MQQADSNSTVVAANSTTKDANATRQSGSTYPTACQSGSADHFDLKTVREAWNIYSEASQVASYIGNEYRKKKNSYKVDPNNESEL